MASRRCSSSQIGLDQLVSAKPCREARLVMAMIVLRVIAPGSKLANLIGLQPETAEHSLAGELGLEDLGDLEMYKAMDWLLNRQNRIENKLAEWSNPGVFSALMPNKRLPEEKSSV